MIKFLIRRFVPGWQDTHIPAVRTRYTMLAGVLGILCNLLLFVVKLVIGTVCGSVAITSDAFNNLSDAASSLIAAVSARLAGQKPDREHPWGHGRLEYVASLVVSFLILFVGLELLQSSFDKLLHPTIPTFSAPAIIILILSVLVKVWMWSYNRHIASLTDSSVLRAAAADSIGDALSSSVVIVSAVAGTVLPVNVPLDGIMGILVSVLIFRCGITIMRETVDLLLGAPADPETVSAVQTIVLSGDGIIGLHDLMIHDYGPGRKFASVHAEIPDTADIRRAHEVVDALEGRIYNELGITAVIHTDPVTVGNAYVDGIRAGVEEAVLSVSDVYRMHDFRLTNGENRINLIFDLVVPLGESPDDTAANAEEIRRRLTEYDPRFRVVMKIENDYTGA
ncbi:MAG: cation transporter [Clostridia bacterium]|nr:cation transporter [Clostridia bacterium]